MYLQIGKVYHQEFADGDRIYCRIMARFANGRYKAIKAEGNRKPVQCSVDGHPSIPWIETPNSEVPKKLTAFYADR
jgi:hypothetical protein